MSVKDMAKIVLRTSILLFCVISVFPQLSFSRSAIDTKKFSLNSHNKSTAVAATWAADHQCDRVGHDQGA